MPELVASAPGSVLAVYAHPDDAEVSCGGTLARWAADGADVHLLVCAQGDKGSADPATDPCALAELRLVETQSAAERLGLRSVDHLGIPDGELENTKDLRGALVARLRRLRPDVVVCPDPTAVIFGESYFNHHDHRAVGWATLDAVAPAARNPHYFPDAGAPHAVSCVYLSGTLEPNVWVDVSQSLEAKIDAVYCHESQLGDAEDIFRSFLRERAEEAGRHAGVRYAEGYRRIILSA
jgi:LmbE family N-acetylglucosaminyl deacetylase